MCSWHAFNTFAETSSFCTFRTFHNPEVVSAEQQKTCPWRELILGGDFLLGTVTAYSLTKLMVSGEEALAEPCQTQLRFPLQRGLLMVTPHFVHSGAADWRIWTRSAIGMSNRPSVSHRMLVVQAGPARR